ncbi:MAG: hypothetical protein R3Y35_05135 [Clostridia bacterium]
MSDKKSADLAALIDQMMSKGSGHINVKVEDDDGIAVVETTNSTECSLCMGACAQPTELSTDEEE